MMTDRCQHGLERNECGCCQRLIRMAAEQKAERDRQAAKDKAAADKAARKALREAKAEAKAEAQREAFAIKANREFEESHKGELAEMDAACSLAA